MSFFDLSIPYIEKSGAPSQDARSRRDCRLRTVARTMELGYTAVAYDRPFRGVLSDADRCQIAPFPPQSFLESVSGCSPAAFSASVALHRDLLGVPHTSPFRQYTRITVSVDSVAAASALNAGNRLLRSYDLVATRPLNQLAFDQACNASEVDIISLDFSQKLPFRLKLAMVQAAIKRGVHFEISYSHIIAGGHAKRQILSDAKRLVEWTRGKSLIISGSTASLSEVRGPCDVANLSTVLLGLTMERAKAAISGNCRSLVANALRKKDCFFKEAIRIERILPEVKMDSQGDWFREWSDWDPISSGENDLPSLDDMTKLFSAASKHSKHQNAVDFTSSINGMPPNASIFSSTCKFELDSAEQHSNVDRASAENVAAMAAASVPNATNEESRPCSEENCREIDVFESASQTSMSISDDLSLKGSGPADVYGAGMIRASSIGDGDVEVAGQVDAMNGENFLECSFVGSRDQISMVDSGTIIALEEHHSEKMEELALLLETSISDDAQIKLKQENQLNSASTAASGIVILSDRSAKLEMQLKENDFGKRNNLKGFLTEIRGKKKRVSAAEIQKVDEFSEDLSTALKHDQCFSSENDSPLNEIQKADEFSEDLSTALKHDQCFSSENDSPLNEMEGQNIQRPAKASGVTDKQIHKSGKQRLRRRSHHRGYLLTARSLCKPLIFKKEVGRLRRMRKFL